ncbi:MAG: Fic family protein [Burkholderiales bacterium]|nr:Fic family protein [Burkholderiales bacterium]
MSTSSPPRRGTTPTFIERDAQSPHHPNVRREHAQDGYRATPEPKPSAVVSRDDGSPIDLSKLNVDLNDWRMNAPQDEREARDRAALAIRRCAKDRRQTLTLSGLSSLPEAIRNLKHVTSLDISENPRLEHLPSCIFDLPGLQTLNAMNCGIKTVPEEIGRLHQLRRLWLADNPELQSLPESLRDIASLENISLEGCHRAKLPADIDLYRVGVSYLPAEITLPFRDSKFDPEHRARIEKSARECHDRWQSLISAFSPGQRASADERDRVNRARLSTTVSHMAASAEEAKDGPTFSNWVKADNMAAEWALGGHPITEEKLFELHRLLYRDVNNSRMSKTLDESGGWRKRDLWAGQTPFPYPKQVPGMMAELLQWYDHTRGSLAGSDRLADHIAFAGQVYQRLVSIHPFADGNGRIGRLAMDWALREAGLPPARLARGYGGSPVPVVLTVDQGQKNKKPELVADLVLEGIQNTLRLYETELKKIAPLGTEDSGMPSDDEEVLAEVSRDLSKEGFFHLP